MTKKNFDVYLYPRHRLKDWVDFNDGKPISKEVEAMGANNQFGRCLNIDADTRREAEKLALEKSPGFEIVPAQYVRG